MASGRILQQVLRSFRRLDVVPYTLTVFLFGMLLGGIDIATSNGMAGLSYNMDNWISMDPSVLFHELNSRYMARPEMPFQTNKQDAHRPFYAYFVVFVVLRGGLLCVQTDFVSVRSACHVRFVYSAFLTAVVSIYIFPYDFARIEGWCFGGMLAATDPVATVALF